MYIGEHVKQLFAGKVGIVQTLLAFYLLIRSRVAHKYALLLSCQAAVTRIDSKHNDK